MSTLPNDIAARKKINEAIEECVTANIRKKDEESFIADTASRIVEETGMSKGEFSKRVKIRLLQVTNPQKYEEEKEWADVAYEENEILSKVE